MPHSSRKKKPTASKRREITGEDGWTRVTKGLSSRLQSLSLVEGSGHNETVPSKGSTIEKLIIKYESIETLWLASESCKILVALLEDRVFTDGLQIDCCVMYGSGSFCGLVREEVERRAVALCQLAVFKTLQRSMGRSSSLEESCANDSNREIYGSMSFFLRTRAVLQLHG